MEINSRSLTAVLKTHADARHTQKASEMGKEQQVKSGESKHETETPVQEDDSPAAMLERFSESLDEMSAFVSLFRNRRDLDKKNGSMSDNVLERVLEEGVESKINTLLNAVEGRREADIQTLLQQLRSLFPDDSDLVLILREMLYNRELDELVKKRLAKLLEHVMKQADPRSLRAGINVALKARLFGKHLNFSPALLRNTYRDFLTNNDHEVDIYQSWVEQYGPLFRHDVVEFMEGALLADMGASDPSCSQLEFGNLLGKLGTVKTIRSSDRVFISVLFNNSMTQQINATETDWLHFMFCILKNAFFLRDYLRDIFGEKMKLLSATQTSVLFSAIYSAFKKLPRNIFYDEQDMDFLEGELKELATLTRNIELTENRKV